MSAKTRAVGGQKRIYNTVTPAASSTPNLSGKFFDIFSKNYTEGRHVQTYVINTETLRSFESLIKRPNSAVFCKLRPF